MERKLIAIFSADVQGYGRLMGEAEEATIRTLTTYRKIMTSRIQQYRGRVVDSPGDNLLAEFASAVDAVQAAVEIQKELKTRNAALSDNRKMHYRIGINVGDVVVEGERIYGDGVNIAARLESLAEGGGISISGTVYDQVKNKLTLRYAYRGEQPVKNITDPVRMYTLELEAPEERWQMTGSGPESYERHLVPAIFAPWATVLLDLARLRPGERVLDAACGTGIVARLALAHVGATGKVTGVDLNPGMLEVARILSAAGGQSIDWREGNVEALPFADGEFAVVLCQQGLQYSPKRAAAVREMYRVLREGGRLVVSVWRDMQYCPYMVAIASALANHVGSEASRRMGAPCSLGSADELRGLMKNAGFKDVHLRIDVLPMRVTSLEAFLSGQFVAAPIAADIGVLDERARVALFDDIKHRLLPYMDDGGLAVPFEAHSVIACR